MSFRMFFGWVKTLIIAVVALAGAAIIVLDAVMISGVNAAFATANVTVAAVSLAAAALIDVLRCFCFSTAVTNCATTVFTRCSAFSATRSHTTTSTAYPSTR